jgi:hypothetical protein
MAAWTHLAHDSLTLPASSVTWSSIPTDGTYDHLCIKVSARTDYSGYYDDLALRFNGDVTGVYSSTYLYAGASAPASSRNAATSQIRNLYGVTAATTLADTFGAIEIWIPNYANTANFKQFIQQGVNPNNSTTDYQWIVGASAGLYASTSAISSIYLAPMRGGLAVDDFVANSTFDLYGILGA